jgi:hypothetical protein
MHPTQIKEKFNQVSLLTSQIIKSYPSQMIKSLSNFHANLKVVLEILGSNNKKVSLNFNNPLIKSPLLMTPTHPIYPQNNDIFIDFSSENAMSLIHSPLTKLKRTKNSEDGIENFSVEIYTDEIKVLTLFSDENMSAFLEFILSQLSGVSIADLLQNIKVPSIENLSSIIESYKLMLAVVESISEQIPKVLDDAMIGLVSQS